jgi:hypothetical protein
MSIVARLDSQACPRCTLSLMVVRESDATTVRYDMAGWERRCQRKDGDGPLGCPWMRTALQSWLRERAGAAPPL